MADNSNNAPAPYAPNVQMLVSVGRTAILLISGTALGAKYLPPDVVTYLTANLSQIILSVLAAVSALYGVYKATRDARLKSAAALPGAVVLLDSQAEADSHPTNPSIVGPSDPIPTPAPKT